MPGKILPSQHQQRQPGLESEMRPRPESAEKKYKAAGKLQGKTAIITGGDSGIGRAVAVMFAKEGADSAIVYCNEHQDAHETKRRVEEAGKTCVLISGDLGDSAFCRNAVEKTFQQFRRLDILVNNAAEQHEQEQFEDISDEQLERVFRTNIFAYFYMTRAALKYLRSGAVIINTSSVTAYEGNSSLIDYSATKGAIVAFTRSLSKSLSERGIRVNGVAPGPIWTPLMPASFPEEEVARFGENTAFGRPGQPDEVAPSYVFLASDDSSFMTGQVLHPNGGRIVNG